MGIVIGKYVGGGISAETSGMNDVFPPDGFSSGPETQFYASILYYGFMISP